MRKLRGVFMKYFLSYLCIAIPILFVTSLVFGSALRILQDEAETQNRIRVQQMGDELELLLTKLAGIADRISIDQALTRTMMSINEYKALKGIEQLQYYRSTDPYLKDIAVAFHDGVVYGTYGRNDVHTYGERLWMFGQEDADLLAGLLMGENNVQFKTLTSLAYTNALLFACNIPRNDPNPIGTVIFLIDQSLLEKALHTMLGDYHGFACLTLANGSYIVWAGDTDPSALMLDEPSDAVQSLRLQGRTLACLGQNIIGGNIRLYMAIDTEQAFECVITTRMITIWTIVGLFGLSLIVAYTLSLRHYKPIMSLADTVARLEPAIGAEAASGENVIDNVRRVIGYTLSENNRLSQLMFESRPLLKQQCLMLLFNGMNGHDETFEKMLKLSGMVLRPSPWYIVMAAQVAGPSDTTDAAIREVMRIPEYAISIQTNIGQRNILAILLLLTELPSLQRELTQTAANVERLLLERGCPQVFIGFGQAYEDLWQTGRSYAESIAALDDCEAGVREVSSFEELTRMRVAPYCFTEQQRRDMRDALKMRDMEAMERSLSKMLHQAKGVSTSTEELYFHLYDLLYIVMGGLRDMGLEQSFISDLVGMNAASPERFELDMHKLFYKICETKKTRSRDPQLIHDVLQYIQANYCDSKLTLEHVASKFSLSMSYFSRVFKEETQSKYIDYVSALRLQEARRLLRETDLSIHEIHLRVGYYDPTSFNRKFKQINGLTPNEYRMHSLQPDGKEAQIS